MEKEKQVSCTDLSFASLHSNGMKGVWHDKLPRSAKPRVPPSIPLVIFFSPHPAVLPYPLAPLSIPSYVLWIHLQIKQIYHSVMEAGKGGRLWNALALREGKGSKRSATLPHTFPAAPGLALSGSVCLSVFLIAMPPQPCLSILVLTVPTKPT